MGKGEIAQNTVGKGKIAHYEQFLFPQCFQKTCTSDKEIPRLVLERVNKKIKVPTVSYSRIRKSKITLSFPALLRETLSYGKFAIR